MKFATLNVLFLMLFVIISVHAQQPYGTGKPSQNSPQAQPGGVIRGKIIDGSDNKPLEYVTVTIYIKETQKLISGSITSTDGKYEITGIKPGKYYTLVKFIGYADIKLPDLEITPNNLIINNGITKLNPSVENLKEISVVADKKAISYQIDKKVITPSQFISASGGSAIDVLVNTPSVSVDIEGNVALRGSGNFMVMINGRPTPFTSTEALQQIPASTIKNIEVITNPSAKYDPDGTAGIINVITKADSRSASNGIINVSASSLGVYTGDFLLNFNRNKTNWYIGAVRSQMLRAMNFESENSRSFPNGDIFYSNSQGERYMGFFSNALKFGVDRAITDKQNIGLMIEAGTNGRRFGADLNYFDWKNSGDTTYSSTDGKTNADGLFWASTVTHDLQLGDNKDHKLQNMIYLQLNNSEDISTSQKRDANNVFSSGTNSITPGNGGELRVKSDYTLPLNKYGKVETGLQYRYSQNNSEYDFKILTTPETYKLSKLSPYYRLSDFSQQIASLYTTYSLEIGKLGFMAGLRGEHTNRKTEFSGIVYPVTRLDWFPSAHFAYKLPSDQQLMASFSRRIERPRDYHLKPYDTWRDATTVSIGDPLLLPEYAASFDLSYQKSFKNGNFISFELFYRNVENSMDRIREAYKDSVNVFAMSHKNIGNKKSYGAETMLNIDVTKWWSANISASSYKLNLENRLLNNNKESFEWDFKMSNTLKVATDTRVQLDYTYIGPKIEAYGERNAFSTTNLSVRQSFLKRKLTASLSVMDIFDTGKMESYAKGSDFTSNVLFDMKSPVVTLSLSYRINNFKQAAPKERPDGGSGGFDF